MKRSLKEMKTFYCANEGADWQQAASASQSAMAYDESPEAGCCYTLRITFETRHPSEPNFMQGSTRCDRPDRPAAANTFSSSSTSNAVL